MYSHGFSENFLPHSFSNTRIRYWHAFSTTGREVRQVKCNDSSERYTALRTLFKGSTVSFSGKVFSDDDPTIQVSKFSLVRVCIPPIKGGHLAIERLLRSHLCGLVPLEEACESLQLLPSELDSLLDLVHLAEMDKDVHAEKSAHAHALKEALLRRCRILCGLPEERPPGRLRQAQHTRRDLETLKNLELKFSLLPIRNATDWGDQAPNEGMAAVHLPSLIQTPRGSVNYGERLAPKSVLPPRPQRSREFYASAKKAPQISWFLAAVGHLLTLLPAQDDLIRIVDVGGGRGDLAVSIASRFPHIMVTVIDKNEPSLTAGESWAKELGLINIRFLCGDAQSQGPMGDTKEGTDPSIRICKALNEAQVFVGLHCCGGLTDLALQLAMRVGAAFLLVPCCYTKHGNLTRLCNEEREITGEEIVVVEKGSWQLLCRLAESPDRGVSSRSARIINSLRLLEAEKKSKSTLSVELLEAFSDVVSAKNIALVGCMGGAHLAACVEKK